jgi:hypothetical protein
MSAIFTKESMETVRKMREAAKKQLEAEQKAKEQTKAKV